MNKLISSCCKAKLWLCGASRKYPKLDANDPDNYKKVERGRTYYYECDKCKQECDAIGETETTIEEWRDKLKEAFKNSAFEFSQLIANSQSEIIIAFCAKYGLLPDECVLCYQGNKFWVEKKRKDNE